MPPAPARPNGRHAASGARLLEAAPGIVGDDAVGSGAVRPEEPVGVEFQPERGIEARAQSAADARVPLHHSANRSVELPTLTLRRHRTTSGVSRSAADRAVHHDG